MTDCHCPSHQTSCGDRDCPRLLPAASKRQRRTDLRPMPAGLKERVVAELAARRASRLSPTEQESSE